MAARRGRGVGRRGRAAVVDLRVPMVSHGSGRDMIMYLTEDQFGFNNCVDLLESGRYPKLNRTNCGVATFNANSTARSALFGDLVAREQYSKIVFMPDANCLGLLHLKASLIYLVETYEELLPKVNISLCPLFMTKDQKDHAEDHYNTYTTTLNPKRFTGLADNDSHDYIPGLKALNQPRLAEHLVDYQPVIGDWGDLLNVESEDDARIDTKQDPLTVQVLRAVFEHAGREWEGGRILNVIDGLNRTTRKAIWWLREYTTNGSAKFKNITDEMHKYDFVCSETATRSIVLTYLRQSSDYLKAMEVYSGGHVDLAKPDNYDVRITEIYHRVVFRDLDFGVDRFKLGSTLSEPYYEVPVLPIMLFTTNVHSYEKGSPLLTPLYSIREMAEDVRVKINNLVYSFPEREPIKGTWGHGIILQVNDLSILKFHSYKTYMEHWFWMVFVHFLYASNFNNDHANTLWLERIKIFLDYYNTVGYVPEIDPADLPGKRHYLSWPKVVRNWPAVTMPVTCRNEEILKSLIRMRYKYDLAQQSVNPVPR